MISYIATHCMIVVGSGKMQRERGGESEREREREREIVRRGTKIEHGWRLGFSWILPRIFHTQEHTLRDLTRMSLRVILQ